MTTGIQLSVLKCPKCMEGMAGSPQSVILYCRNCTSGYEVLQGDLAPVTVYFARTSRGAANQAPFWAFNARLDLIQRLNKSNLSSLVENVARGILSSDTGGGLIRIFEERGTLRFYAPAAFDRMESLAPAALKLTCQQPELEYLNPLPEIPDVTISQEDARVLADYLFIKSEVERKDKLQSLSYHLHLENPFLLSLLL